MQDDGERVGDGVPQRTARGDVHVGIEVPPAGPGKGRLVVVHEHVRDAVGAATAAAVDEVPNEQGLVGEAVPSGLVCAVSAREM